MKNLQSRIWQISILPILLAAALLLPTLHLHQIAVHHHGTESHQHAVIHADFIIVLSRDHNHTGHEDEIPREGSAPESSSQSNLSILIARSNEAVLAVLDKVPPFLVHDLSVSENRRIPFPRILKRERPPPQQEIDIAANSPRSPPLFV